MNINPESVFCETENPQEDSSADIETGADINNTNAKGEAVIVTELEKTSELIQIDEYPESVNCENEESLVPQNSQQES